ncbi:MAG TPA: hypothetical protein V6D22_03265 [Candidatus Obscuribacterales bacterium]
MATQDAPKKQDDNTNANGKDQSPTSALHDEAVKSLSSPKDRQDKQPDSSSSGGFFHQAKLFGEGLISGSVFNAVNGVTQLADHVLHTNIGTHLEFSNQSEVDNSLAGKIGETIGTGTNPTSLLGTQEGMLFTEGAISGAVLNPINGVGQLFGAGPVQLDNQKDVDGSWAGKIGEVVGTGADMVGLTIATGGIAGAAGLTGYTALAVSAGTAGAIDGAAFTPSADPNHLLTSRLESAAIGGFAGAAGVGAGAAVNAAANGIEGAIASTAVRYGGNTAAGALVGAAPVEIGSLLNTGELAPLDANLTLAIAAGAAGGLMTARAGARPAEAGQSGAESPDTERGTQSESPTYTGKDGTVFKYYDNGEQPPAEPMKAYRAKASSAEHAEVSEAPFKWKDWQGNPMDADAGDWRITGKNGSVRSVKPDIFKQTYEETSPGSGMYLKTAITNAEKLTAPAAVKTLEGTGTGQAGDYLITGPQGERYIASKSVFEGKYDEAVGGAKQPVQETPVAQPVRETPDAQPARETPVAQPVRETPPEGKDSLQSAKLPEGSPRPINAVAGDLTKTNGTVAMLINSEFAPGGAVDGAMLDAMGNDKVYQNAKAEFTRRTQLPADDPAYIDPKNPDGKAIVVDVPEADRGNANLSRAVFVIDNFKDDANLSAYTKAAIDAADATSSPGDTLSFSLFRGGMGGALTGITEKAAIAGMRDGMLEARPQNIEKYNVVFYDRGQPNHPQLPAYIQARDNAFNGRY